MIAKVSGDTDAQSFYAPLCWWACQINPCALETSWIRKILLTCTEILSGEKREYCTVNVVEHGGGFASLHILHASQMVIQKAATGCTICSQEPLL